MSSEPAAVVPTLDLPDGVLAKILAGVPLGKCKVALQSVSKQWQRVLHQPEAHARSLELLPEGQDDGMPACPNTVRPNQATSWVSQAFLDALVCYTVRFSFDEEDTCILAGLPHQLRELSIPCTPSICCQLLEHLKVLRCSDLVKHPLSPMFPRLEEADIRVFADDLDMVMADLENIHSLHRLKVRASFRFADFHGPPECRVHYVIHTFVNSIPEVPLGMSAHLDCVTVRAESLVPDTDRSNIVLNLAVFSQCFLLENISVLGARPFEGWNRVHVCGLDKVPAACKSIIILTDVRHRKGAIGDREMPWVHPENGWQINMQWVENTKRGVKLSCVALI